jgi:DNA-binding ferritin-like protein (Dps family)
MPETNTNSLVLATARDASEVTLEDYTERTLLYGRENLVKSSSQISSDQNAQEIFEFILEKLEKAFPVSRKSPADVTEADINILIDDVIEEFDGFH